VGGSLPPAAGPGWRGGAGATLTAMAEGDFTSCGFCGRTILSGERVAEYLAPDGARIGVCALCKSGAEAAGWVPAELAGSSGGERATRRRGLGLRQRLSKASAAARDLATRPSRPEEDVDSEPAPDRPPRSEVRKAADPARQPDRRQPRAGAPRHSREGDESQPPPRRRPQPRREKRPPAPERARADENSGQPPRERPPSPERVLRTAIDHFNASREPRKVAGLIRSLGEPRVTVRRKSARAVLVTVAWELSWYQWEVSGDGSGELVRQSAKGAEVGELGERDRAWNASTSGDGTLTLERDKVATPPPEAG